MQTLEGPVGSPPGDTQPHGKCRGTRRLGMETLGALVRQSGPASPSLQNAHTQVHGGAREGSRWTSHVGGEDAAETGKPALGLRLRARPRPTSREAPGTHALHVHLGIFIKHK